MENNRRKSVHLQTMFTEIITGLQENFDAFDEVGPLKMALIIHHKTHLNLKDAVIVAKILHKR